MYHYSYSIIWVLIYVCYCSKAPFHLLPFYWWTMGPWKVVFPVFHHAASIIISLPCCEGHMKDIFILGVQSSGSSVFEKICIVGVTMYPYGRGDVCLVHSGDERYWKRFLLTIGPIMVDEWSVYTSTFAIYSVSNTYSILMWNEVESRCIWGFFRLSML